jgi:hypothetical protein
MKIWLASSLRFAWSAAAFVVSVYAFSNLMPLILRIATSGFNVADGLPFAEYLLAASLAILILAKEIYRLDWKAGRVRNRVRCFE